ncbi:hypothetical protein ACFLTX_00180 [Chloroflexota bacterium]
MNTLKTYLMVIGVFLISLACRPVFAIGGSEILLLTILIIILLWPIAVRIYKWSQRNNDDKRDGDSHK